MEFCIGFAFCVVGFVDLIGKCNKFVSIPADGADISVCSASKTVIILEMPSVWLQFYQVFATALVF